MAKKAKPCAEPCHSCPFRRSSFPGWLGAAAPERFVLAIYAESPLPCHKTIDYSDPKWRQHWERRDRDAKLCTGSLAFYANIIKRPRNPELIHGIGKHDDVFNNPEDFIAHHRKHKGSWSKAEDRRALKAWKSWKAFPLTGHACDLLEEMS